MPQPHRHGRNPRPCCCRENFGTRKNDREAGRGGAAQEDTTVKRDSAGKLPWTVAPPSGSSPRISLPSEQKAEEPQSGNHQFWFWKRHREPSGWPANASANGPCSCTESAKVRAT